MPAAEDSKAHEHHHISLESIKVTFDRTKRMESNTSAAARLRPPTQETLHGQVGTHVKSSGGGPHDGNCTCCSVCRIQRKTTQMVL
jgi:hypothetical protein